MITPCEFCFIYEVRGLPADIVSRSPFVIIVFSSLLLMFMLVGSVALLFSVGDTKLPSTLTLAVGGHMKRD